jgi:AI-2E family transporter
MSSNTTDTPHGKAATGALPSGRARQRRLILALTVLAFIAIGSVALYAIALILGAVILLLLSALLAYLIYPLVQFLQGRLPRALAIAVAYLLVAGVMAVGMFIVTSSLVRQSSSLAQSIQILLSPAGERRIQGLIDWLGKIGITKDQVTLFKNQLFAQVMGALSGLIPFLSGLLGNFIDLIAVITLSVYFVLDGPRIIGWLSLKTPVTYRSPLNFLLHALDQSLGGYFRGSLLLALIGALGTGLALLLYPRHRPLCDRSVVYPGGSPTGVDRDADRGRVYDAAPGGSHGADTLTTCFQQDRWRASHCGPVRALRGWGTLRIAWRVPLCTGCWRSPADHRGSLAQVETSAFRTIPARRVASSTIRDVARTRDFPAHIMTSRGEVGRIIPATSPF